MIARCVGITVGPVLFRVTVECDEPAARWPRFTATIARVTSPSHVDALYWRTGREVELHAATADDAERAASHCLALHFAGALQAGADLGTTGLRSKGAFILRHDGR